MRRGFHGRVTTSSFMVLVRRVGNLRYDLGEPKVRNKKVKPGEAEI